MNNREIAEITNKVNEVLNCHFRHFKNQIATAVRSNLKSGILNPPPDWVNSSMGLETFVTDLITVKLALEQHEKVVPFSGDYESKNAIVTLLENQCDFYFADNGNFCFDCPCQASCKLTSHNSKPFSCLIITK